MIKISQTLAQSYLQIADQARVKTNKPSMLSQHGLGFKYGEPPVSLSDQFKHDFRLLIISKFRSQPTGGAAPFGVCSEVKGGVQSQDFFGYISQSYGWQMRLFSHGLPYVYLLKKGHLKCGFS